MLSLFVFDENVGSLFLFLDFAVLDKVLLCKYDSVVNSVTFNCDFVHVQFYCRISQFANRNQTLLQC